ncbi:MAG: patatin-like phospholipase family protein [Luteibaculaceae bacterium]
MTAKVSIQDKIDRIRYFFPIQLLLIHLKRNHLILAVWVLLFAYATESLSERYGIPYLFLFPEYMGNVGFLSFFVFGLCMGVFITVFHLHTYIIYGDRFPFLATLRYPFSKFALNNFLIPGIFVVTYLYYSIRFQRFDELLEPAHILSNCAGFIAGLLAFILVSLGYFITTNSNIFKIANLTDDKGLDLFLGSKQKKMFTEPQQTKKWRVVTYLSSPFKINLARDASHYDKEILQKVFNQNHVNGSLFEVLLIIAFFAIGSFSYLDWVKIPAGGSFLILLSILLMLFSAGFTWLKGWTRLLFVSILIGLNFLSVRQIFIVRENHAYGLQYNKENYADYNAYKLTEDIPAKQKAKIDNTKRLYNWLGKQESAKPKLIIVSVSGGGLRSAYWTYTALNELQNQSNAAFFKQAHLITGASGGMLGAAYFRSLYYEIQNNDSTLSFENKKEHIVKDLLNPILFSLATNDFFIRYKKFEYAGESYFQDRAYAFEKQFHKNTDSLLAKPLSYFKPLEQQAEIPSLIVTPTIINDGKRLYISPHSLYHLGIIDNTSVESKNTNDVVDLHQLLKDNTPDNLLLSSALRMSATFPYVLPSITLPTNPEVEIMDAGIRDNLGLKTAFEYLRANKEWIEKNTSGVEFLVIQDRNPVGAPTKELNPSLVSKLLNPLNNIYSNLLRIQVYNLEAYFEGMHLKIGVPVAFHTLQLDHGELDREISLSWHLTQREKLIIDEAIKHKKNQEAIANFLNSIEP